MSEEKNFTAEEMMTIAAARQLEGTTVCFVGIGLPSAAANLARLSHAPDVVLIYESGTVGTKPSVLPLSIGDGELAATASTVVSVPEMFRYWLQGGKVDIGFLGAAQLDKYGNINTTVIGDYDNPKVRLPGAGGAPEIATQARESYVMLRQSSRTFVEEVDFITSPGFLNGGDARERHGITTAGPTRVITDLGILTPHPETRELELAWIHPGVMVEEVHEATGWPLKVRKDLRVTEKPRDEELRVLRDLKERTRLAHANA